MMSILDTSRLKGKVLIKGKRILPSTDNNQDDDSDSEDSVMSEDSKEVCHFSMWQVNITCYSHS